jgi:hypothetical protein
MIFHHVVRNLSKIKKNLNYTNATKILHLIDKKSLKKMTDYDSVPPRLMRDEENIRGKAYGHTPKTYLV